MKGGLSKRWWNYLKYLKCFRNCSVVEANRRNAVKRLMGSAKVRGCHQNMADLSLTTTFCWFVYANCKLVYTKSKCVIKHIEWCYSVYLRYESVLLYFFSILKFLWFTTSLKIPKQSFVTVYIFKFFWIIKSIIECVIDSIYIFSFFAGDNDYKVLLYTYQLSTKLAQY